MKTIQKQITKKHLLDILYYTDDLLSFVDTDFIYRAANEAYAKKFNKNLKDIVGHFVWDIVGDEIFETIIKSNLTRAFNGEKFHFEGWFEFPNTSRCYLIVKYNPCYTENGKMDGVVVTATDTTLLKLAEEDKQRQENTIKEASRLGQIGNMIAYLSHQWRPPLNRLSISLLCLREWAVDNPEMSSIITRSETILKNLSANLDSVHALYT